MPPYMAGGLPQKGGSNIRMKYFQKKISRYFFSKISDPPITINKLFSHISFPKHDPMFISKPFFKKISGENFIPKYRPFKR